MKKKKIRMEIISIDCIYVIFEFYYTLGTAGSGTYSKAKFLDYYNILVNKFISFSNSNSFYSFFF